MDKNTLVIGYLSLSLLVVQLFWIKAEKKAAYLQGQQDLYQQMAKMGEER